MTSMLPCLTTDLQGMCSWAETVLQPLVGGSLIQADVLYAYKGSFVLDADDDYGTPFFFFFF